MYFTEVILPLSLSKTFTYSVSESEFDFLKKGESAHAYLQLYATEYDSRHFARLIETPGDLIKLYKIENFDQGTVFYCKNSGCCVKAKKSGNCNM